MKSHEKGFLTEECIPMHTHLKIVLKINGFAFGTVAITCFNYNGIKLFQATINTGTLRASLLLNASQPP